MYHYCNQTAESFLKRSSFMYQSIPWNKHKKDKGSGNHNEKTWTSGSWWFGEKIDKDSKWVDGPTKRWVESPKGHEKPRENAEKKWPPPPKKRANKAPWKNWKISLPKMKGRSFQLAACSVMLFFAVKTSAFLKPNSSGVSTCRFIRFNTFLPSPSCTSGWWFFINPFEKYAQVKMGSSSPRLGVKNKKYLSYHHLEYLRIWHWAIPNMIEHVKNVYIRHDVVTLPPHTQFPENLWQHVVSSVLSILFMTLSLTMCVWTSPHVFPQKKR